MLRSNVRAQPTCCRDHLSTSASIVPVCSNCFCTACVTFSRRRKGSLTRGVPTAYAASPLKEQIAPDGEPVPVWPYAEGTVRGYSFSPLHKNAPLAALEDQRFYELLALVDALREGRARERELAGRELKLRLEASGHAASQS